MSEEVINDIDICSLNPDSISQLIEFRIHAIDAFVAFYGQNLDKYFGKLTENLSEEKAKKFTDVREKHLKQYQSYIDDQLEQQMRQLFEDKSIARKLVYISDNFEKHPTDLITVHSAIDPIRMQFLSQLKTFEQSIDGRLESKNRTVNELAENLTKTKQSYESMRKSLQKKVSTIIKDLDSIEIPNLELNPNSV